MLTCFVNIPNRDSSARHCPQLYLYDNVARWLFDTSSICDTKIRFRQAVVFRYTIYLRCEKLFTTLRIFWYISFSIRKAFYWHDNILRYRNIFYIGKGFFVSGSRLEEFIDTNTGGGDFPIRIPLLIFCTLIILPFRAFGENFFLKKRRIRKLL